MKHLISNFHASRADDESVLEAEMPETVGIHQVVVERSHAAGGTGHDRQRGSAQHSPRADHHGNTHPRHQLRDEGDGTTYNQARGDATVKKAQLKKLIKNAYHQHQMN